MGFAFFVVAAILLLLLVSGGYVFIFACVRRKELPWLVEKEISKTPFSPHYKNIVAADQWLKSHYTEDVYITSDDGLKLHGLWLPADNPRGTVLFAHGYRSCILVDFGLAFEFYHAHGMNLLIPDQRAHGKSQGNFITFGVKESKDMQRWIDYHNAHCGNYPVMLSGLSMGATTMLNLADKELPENVKGIIADCGFTSPNDILSSVFTRVTHLPAVPSLWITDVFTRVFAGFSIYQCDTRKSLSKCRIPVLLIHGTDDSFVPCEMTKKAYSACGGPKELLLVEGAEHGVSFLVDKESYTQAVTAFMDRILGDRYELRNDQEL